MKTIAVLGTFDTKGNEHQFVAEQMSSVSMYGNSTTVVQDTTSGAMTSAIFHNETTDSSAEERDVIESRNLVFTLRRRGPSPETGQSAVAGRVSPPARTRRQVVEGSRSDRPFWVRIDTRRP